jgi:hypothetical protein
MDRAPSSIDVVIGGHDDDDDNDDGGCGGIDDGAAFIVVPVLVPVVDAVVVGGLFVSISFYMKKCRKKKERWMERFRSLVSTASFLFFFVFERGR